MAQVIADEALPAKRLGSGLPGLGRALPKEPAAWRKLIDYLIEHGPLRRWRKPRSPPTAADFQDDFEPVRMRADLEMQRGSAGAALAVYDRAFQPLWPETCAPRISSCLEDEGQLREFVGRARTALRRTRRT